MFPHSITWILEQLDASSNVRCWLRVLGLVIKLSYEYSRLPFRARKNKQILPIHLIAFDHIWLYDAINPDNEGNNSSRNEQICFISK